MSDPVRLAPLLWLDFLSQGTVGDTIFSAVSEEQLIVNGIDGATGEYLLPPHSVRQLAGIVHRQPGDEDQIQTLRWWISTYLNRSPRRGRGLKANRGLKAGLDPKKLEDAGRGVIFAQRADPAVREALVESSGIVRRKPLANASRVTRSTPASEVIASVSRSSIFFSATAPAQGPPIPRRFSTLLIVGDPAHVPYRFQY